MTISISVRRAFVPPVFGAALFLVSPSSPAQFLPPDYYFAICNAYEIFERGMAICVQHAPKKGPLIKRTFAEWLERMPTEMPRGREQCIASLVKELKASEEDTGNSMNPKIRSDLERVTSRLLDDYARDADEDPEKFCDELKRYMDRFGP